MAYLGYFSGPAVASPSPGDCYVGGNFETRKCQSCEDPMTHIASISLGSSVVELWLCLTEPLSVRSWTARHFVPSPVVTAPVAQPVASEESSLFGNFDFATLMVNTSQRSWNEIVDSGARSGSQTSLAPCSQPKPKRDLCGWPAFFLEWAMPAATKNQSEAESDDVDDDLEDYWLIVNGSTAGRFEDDAYSPPTISELFCDEVSKSPEACIRAGFSVPLWFLDEAETLAGLKPVASLKPPPCSCGVERSLCFQILPSLVFLWQKSAPKFHFPVDSLGLLTVYSCMSCAHSRETTPWLALQLER